MPRNDVKCQQRNPPSSVRCSKRRRRRRSFPLEKVGVEFANGGEPGVTAQTPLDFLSRHTSLVHNGIVSRGSRFGLPLSRAIGGRSTNIMGVCNYNRLNGILRRFTKLRDGIASAGYATPLSCNQIKTPRTIVL